MLWKSLEQQCVVAPNHADPRNNGALVRCWRHVGGLSVNEQQKPMSIVHL